MYINTLSPHTCTHIFVHYRLFLQLRIHTSQESNALMSEVKNNYLYIIHKYNGTHFKACTCTLYMHTYTKCVHIYMRARTHIYVPLGVMDVLSNVDQPYIGTNCEHLQSIQTVQLLLPKPMATFRGVSLTQLGHHEYH